MASNEGIFSMRLVIADFYVDKPITGLDPCYSEFRGKEIKKVPIIRIFGSNAQGQKTCMHVHGVFPYFYIPYDHKDFESVNKAMYQIAMNLDKAINISLSQGSSSAQHVFKVQLVKGIPFYGYHRAEHHFLKIYMFNPRFVRRAANLLQNGAIMNKNFHPHESHVPYILQFMIDYNLYGMSFLHVPLEIVKFRRCDTSETIAFKNIHDSQILDFNLAKKLSCSSLEVDIGSSFILNRFQIITKTNSSHTNPGIESIWNDERLRRQKMAQTLDDEEKLKTIPPLEIPSTQERPDAHPTESEIFYRTALLSKLLAMETSLLESSQITDQTMNCTLSTNLTNHSNTTPNTNNSSIKKHKRTFNLSKILQNSVYPEECTVNDNLVNASVIQNHLSNNNVFQQSIIVNSDDLKLMEQHKIPHDESVFLDDTVIDEELVLSLTQNQNRSHHVPLNATLREEDMELLDILQQLEENNEDKIDLDSSLAPMTQTHKNFAVSPKLLDKETTASIRQQTLSESESDEEKENDDNIHDFSIALENLDDLILKLTQTQKKSPDDSKDSVPQTDGSDDLPKTPKKRSTTKNPNSPPRTPTTPKNRRVTLGGSPSRSPRTPKNCHRYAPLPLVITNRSTGKKTNINTIVSDVTPTKEPTLEQDKLPVVSLRKKLALSEIRRKSISVDTEVQDHVTILAESPKLTKRRSKRIVNLDKTHITCALTPRRTSVNLLKVYSVDNKDNDADQIVEDNVEMYKNRTKNKAKKDDPLKTLLNEHNCKIQADVGNSIRKYTSLEQTAVKTIKTLIDNKQSTEKSTKSNTEELTAIKYAQRKDVEIPNSCKVVSDTILEQTAVEMIRTRIDSKQSTEKSTKSNTGELSAIKYAQRKDVEIPNSCKVVSNTNSVQKFKNITNSKQNCTSQTDKVVYATETETEEEILDSDTEPDVSIRHLRKTPNLKRLRRSFLATNAAKRRRLTVSNIEHVVNSSKFENPNEISNILNEYEATCSNTNPSKFDKNPNKNSKTSNEVEATTLKTNTKIPFKIRKCRVKLKKLPDNLNKTKCNVGYDKVVKNNSNVQAISIRQLNSTDSLKKLELSSESSVNVENSNVCLVHDQPSGNKMPYNDSMNYPVTYEIIQNQNESLKTNNIDEFETSDSVSVSRCSRDVTTKLQLPESSDEEITETPPKNKSNEHNALSFDRKSLVLHSPALFTQNSSPSFEANAVLKTSKYPTRSSSLQSEAYITLSSSNEAISNSQSSPPLETKLVLTPLDLPPNRDEVLKGCSKLQFPEFDFQQPFYSNPDDITKQKELGFTVLQIPGNKLNDVEEFKSILGSDLKGLSTWRREELLKLAGPEILNKYRNAQRVREYLANQKTVSMKPQLHAPTRQEVKLWLKARELLQNKGEKDEELNAKPNDEDSPIKIRRQKVTMMLNAGADGEGEGDSDDADNSLDCSSRSLTLTPLTPGTPAAKVCLKSSLQESFTPLTTKIDKISIKRGTSIRNYKNLRAFRRVSLTKKLKESLESENSCQSKKSSQENDKLKGSQDSIIPNSQTSETSVSSQTALAELERSSFMRHIQQHDVTVGGLTNNSTLNNTFGFKVALENLQQAKADIEHNYLTIVTLEVFVATRDDLYPNPQVDEIRCLFYAVENSIPNDQLDNDKKLPQKSCGYIMVHDARDIVVKEGRIHGIDSDIEVTVVHTEVEALEALLGLCSRWDPDIYAGYEIEMSSWGFVIERAKYLCLNIAPLLSRVPTQKVREFVDEDRESFTDLDIEMKLCGRILLDVWRLLRSEIALTSYTFENVMYHIMHKRCPWHSYRSLTDWFASPCSRWIVIEYYLERVRGTLALLDQLDLIGRTSEMAKLIGIQFYEVLSRGSQFRVESMMLRIAKPKNLVPLSPSVQQRAHMRAPEYLALIMEPQSRFYADPLIVLDFQSLYPSMIIGYNYCFSTCLGRVEHLGQSTPFEFGASQLRVSPTMLRKLIDRDLITISPCGVVFVKSSVCEGILPRMLTEILDTRQMVKQSMKLHKTNTALQRILHSRQLGLKLMANVTYGYTAANFSGRMPAVEVGDTVVSKGRETLERAIKMVEANERWNVKVVYGDTDSMFVLVPGRNRAEAFRIGDEIAEAVTKQNPHPVKLKLEKVYQPCILQTKKRYVGYMYETPDQKEPVYEAKGIETVRRDGCPVVAKMLEKVLRILFESADVSQVKQYVCRQFTKLLSGRANLQDLIFAKEFRGLNGYKPTACVPALELTRKWIQNDPRRIPRKGERVPFIITNGPPGVPLIRLIRYPHDVLADEGLKINAIYYITKAIIPPLNRCLLLLGADVNEWFANLPRKILLTPALSVANVVISCPSNTRSKKSTISQFFSTTNCIVDCGRQTKQGICMECNRNSTRSMIILQSKISKIERSYLSTQNICQSCCGRVGDLNCGSLDCPVLYVAEVKRRDLQQIIHYRNLLEERF